MNKHTPGPWSSRGRAIRGPHPKDPAGRARIVAKAIWDNGTYVDEAEANARLIAAAPELLEALEDLVCLAERAMRESESGEWMVDEELRDARDAIEKARGA
jgi:hypothetical protein